MKKKKWGSNVLLAQVIVIVLVGANTVRGSPERRGLHLDHDEDGAKVMARAGTNITLACPGVLPDSFIYVVEWKCLDCLCANCPNPNGDGARILRYNDNKLMRWDGQKDRRVLDVERYGLHFQPVRAEDSGTYHCLINNRLEPDSPILLTVQDVPDAPPSRPMIVGLGPRRVELSWAPPRSSHHHPVTSYRVYIKEGEQGNWSRFVDTDANTTNYVIEDLKPFTTYLFRVGASNILGLSKPSIESYPTKTHRERPSGRPSFVLDKISTSSNTLSIVWRPPPSGTLNGEFMGYVLNYEVVNNPRPSRRKEAITIKEDVLRIQNYTLTNLQKHTDYRVSIAAKNLNGVGPEASIELRTEDGVPLEPRSPRIRDISARTIELTWHPPSNARSLGSDLLGYRVYVDPLCSSLRKATVPCRPISPVTISAGYSSNDILTTKINDLNPATKYKFTLRAFTKKREGPASDDLIVYTDTEPPSSPRIQNITCYGSDEILIEWTRPEVAYTPIKYYQLRFRSRDGSHEEEIRIDVVNDTKRNLASLSNLTTQSVYEFSVIAVVSSKIDPVKTYAGPPSPIKRVYVYGECDPHQAFSKVPYQFEYNAGILSGIICTAASLILIVLVTIICRRHRSHYEFLSLSPRKILGSGGPGWSGDPESDIPVVLFPKHVTGLHAAHDMAFQKDFESVHESRKCNGSSSSSSKAASTYPDILNGRNELSGRSPILVDGWAVSRTYICLLGEIPFTTDSTWRSIWDQRVSLIVTLLTPVAKDDLSTLSDDTSFGDITVSLVSDDILPDYTIRTVKLKHRKHSKEERLCTQIIFPRWPEVGLPRSSDLIHFVKAAFACHQAGGSILVHSRVGMDSCIIFLTLNTLLCQIRSRGEVNVPSYSRHLSRHHDLALSSVECYIYIHDTLSVAVECGLLAGIMSASSSSSSTGTSASTTATAINGIIPHGGGSILYHS